MIGPTVNLISKSLGLKLKPSSQTGAMHTPPIGPGMTRDFDVDLAALAIDEAIKGEKK